VQSKCVSEPVDYLQIKKGKEKKIFLVDLILFLVTWPKKLASEDSK